MCLLVFLMKMKALEGQIFLREACDMRLNKIKKKTLVLLIEIA